MQGKYDETEENIQIEGTHDIDYKWMQTVREKNTDIKIGINNYDLNYSLTLVVNLNLNLNLNLSSENNLRRLDSYTIYVFGNRT